MGYLDSYADRLNNDSLAESVKKTADSAYQFIENFLHLQFKNTLSALSFGNCFGQPNIERHPHCNVQQQQEVGIKIGRHYNIEQCKQY